MIISSSRELDFCKQKIALKETASITLGVPSTAISSNCLYATMDPTTIRSIRTPFDNPRKFLNRYDRLTWMDYLSLEGAGVSSM